jgi:prepilin-type N-terminal cleavage/methylation domain-containing protein
MLKKTLRNQKGFTLIEIIAVLVILGILAAVAIPKYFDMQGQARQKAIEGAAAAIQSTATMEYAKGLLNAQYTATSGPTDNTTVNVGDFTGSYTTTGNPGITTVTVTGGPAGWNTFTNPAPNTVKTFTMHD